MKHLFFSGLVTWAFLNSAATAAPAEPVEHVVVYREAGKFAGWPANHGIWSWEDEILVGFEIGEFKQTDRGHAIDYTRPARHVLARSLDGGRSWSLERPASLQPPSGILVAGVPTAEGGKDPVVSPGGIPFDHPDFILTARMASYHVGPSRFYWSIDRGKTWAGPFEMPEFNQPGIAARTDYIVDGPRELTLFLTAAKSNLKEGRVICVRTRDRGESWRLVSYVGPEPEGFSIQPSTVRLSWTELFATVRRRETEGEVRKGWIGGYRSLDNGETWKDVGPVTDSENPPSLLQLEDGRLAVAYGYRLEPYGLRARVSEDKGASWGAEIVLRDDGGSGDLGYAQTVQRPDGRLVTVYYYNEDEDLERFIAATIWKP